MKEFPAITSISKKLKIIEKAGFKIIKKFILPNSAWWDDFYGPLEVRIRNLSVKYRNNPKALDLLKKSQKRSRCLENMQIGMATYFMLCKKTDE